MNDSQGVTWAAFAILAMFYIYDDCNIFAGNRTHWSSTGSPVGVGSPQSGKLTHLLGFTEQKLCQMDFKKEKTSCRSNDKHKIQRRYEGSNICSIWHNYGNFCQVTVTLLHKTFVAKYIFIFNRVLCCKKLEKWVSDWIHKDGFQ